MANVASHVLLTASAPSKTHALLASLDTLMTLSSRAAFSAQPLPALSMLDASSAATRSKDRDLSALPARLETTSFSREVSVSRLMAVCP
jgi:hypothetical protein